MNKQTLLFSALLMAMSIHVSVFGHQLRPTVNDHDSKESSVPSDETSVGYKIAEPDTAPFCGILGGSSACQGTPLLLTAQVVGGTPPFTYLWSTGATTVSLSVTTSGTYTVTITDGNAAITNCNKTVTINPPPPAFISGASSICFGSSTMLTASGGLTYSWSPTTGLNDPNTSNPIASPAVTTTYTVTVTSTAGCTATASKTLTVNPLPNASIIAGGPTTFCSGGAVTLNAVVANNRTYQWKKGINIIAGATASSYIANVQGLYKVIVTNTVTGCLRTTGTGIQVNVNNLPVVQITPSGTISFCAGQSATLKATNQLGYLFQWKKNNVNINGAIADSLVVTTAGKYKVMVTDPFGCVKTSKVDTVVVPCRLETSEAGEPAGSLVIAPNPASDYLDVQLTSFAENNSIQIYDILGNKFFNKTIAGNEMGKYSESLDISNLPAGVYIFKVVNETGQQVKKFIKE